VSRNAPTPSSETLKPENAKAANLTAKLALMPKPALSVYLEPLSTTLTVSLSALKKWPPMLKEPANLAESHAESAKMFLPALSAYPEVSYTKVNVSRPALLDFLLKLTLTNVKNALIHVLHVLPSTNVTLVKKDSS
jgi:hypothetical protein